MNMTINSNNGCYSLTVLNDADHHHHISSYFGIVSEIGFLQFHITMKINPLNYCNTLIACLNAGSSSKVKKILCDVFC